MGTMKKQPNRAGRFDTPEDVAGKLRYSDGQGNRLSANDWLEKVKADAKAAKSKK